MNDNFILKHSIDFSPFPPKFQQNVHFQETIYYFYIILLPSHKRSDFLEYGELCCGIFPRETF